MVPGGSSDATLPTSNFAFYQVPKLKDDGTNWVTYRTRLETAIGSKGLKRHLLGQARKPKPLEVDEDGTPLARDGTTPTTETEIEENETKLDEYDQKEFAVKQALFGS